MPLLFVAVLPKVALHAAEAVSAGLTLSHPSVLFASSMVILTCPTENVFITDSVEVRYAAVSKI